MRSMRQLASSILITAATALFSAVASAGPEVPLASEVLAQLKASGLPLSSFGLYARAVDGADVPLAALNEDKPFRLASTAKVVTSLAALELLGAANRQPLRMAALSTVADVHTSRRAAPLTVTVYPRPGALAGVALHPDPGSVSLLNGVTMGSGGCAAWASSSVQGGVLKIFVGGRWEPRCGRREIAQIDDAPAETTAPATRLTLATAADEAPSLPQLLRHMNKTSDNAAARGLLQSLSAGATDNDRRSPPERMRAWLQLQGIAPTDIRIELGSGESHAECGKPRAMVQLLTHAWRTPRTRAVLLDSLPIAGVDGTLAARMRGGPAAGNAFLKTGTLGNTRALAGYVRARSGQVYAVAALVNDPRAAQGTAAIDRFIEWVATSG